MASYADAGGSYTVAILFPVFGAAAVAWRFIYRLRRKLPLNIDDWLCIPAVVFTIACGLVIVVGAAQGAIGAHSDPQNSENAGHVIILDKSIYAFTTLAYLAVGFIKLSFVFLYQRIFRGRLLGIVTWALAGCISLWAVLSALILVFSCGGNFDYIWASRTTLEAHCVNIYDQYVAGAAIDLIFDICLVTIPIIMVVPLNLPLGSIIAAACVLLVGALSIVATILRLVASVSLESQDHSNNGSILGVAWSDQLGKGSVLLLWAMLEIGIGLIACCLPSTGIFPAFHQAVTRLRQPSHPLTHRPTRRDIRHRPQMTPQQSRRRQTTETSRTRRANSQPRSTHKSMASSYAGSQGSVRKLVPVPDMSNYKEVLSTQSRPVTRSSQSEKIAMLTMKDLPPPPPMETDVPELVGDLLPVRELADTSRGVHKAPRSRRSGAIELPGSEAQFGELEGDEGVSTEYIGEVEGDLGTYKYDDHEENLEGTEMNEMQAEDVMLPSRADEHDPHAVVSAHTETSSIAHPNRSASIGGGTIIRSGSSNRESLVEDGLSSRRPQQPGDMV